MNRTLTFVGLVMMFTACVNRPAERDRGATGLFDRAVVIAAPTTNRCQVHSGQRRKACDEAKYLADIFVRKLSTGDDVCLEEKFGENDLSGCPARAAVVDLGSHTVLLEIRAANPDTQWIQKIQQQFWFEEGALVDLYLRDHGY